MYPNSAVDREFALTAARALAEQCGTDRCREIFSVLLRNKQLSHTVHHLNALLNNKEHADLAADALCCLGFPGLRDPKE